MRLDALSILRKGLAIYGSMLIYPTIWLLGFSMEAAAAAAIYLTIIYLANLCHLPQENPAWLLVFIPLVAIPVFCIGLVMLDRLMTFLARITSAGYKITGVLTEKIKG